MPRKHFLFIVLVLLLTSILAIGVRPVESYDVTVFSENFDNASTGHEPTWWMGEWPTVCFLTVNDTIFHGSSGKSARYVDTISNSSGYSGVERRFSAESGHLVFSFAIMAENPDYFSLYIDDWNFAGANIYFLPNMTLAYYDGDYHYLRPFSVDTWYEIKMDINITANTYDIYIDGSLEAQGAPFNENEFGKTQHLSRVEFGENPYGTPSGFIDDLSLVAQRSPPEPSVPLKVVNPLTGDEWFNFSSHDKSVGDTFIANITVSNVSTLFCWQIGLKWNASLMECINITLPPDNVFALAPRMTDYPIAIGGPDLSKPGYLVFGAAISYVGEIGFNGSGVLAQAEFRILQKGGQTEISFSNTGSLGDTFLVHLILGSDIPVTTISGHYSHSGSDLLGDVNLDGSVNMRDIKTVTLAFNSFPNTPRWNRDADLDGSGRIDMRDLVIIVLNFKRR